MAAAISLGGMVMAVSATAAMGVVGSDTRITFEQWGSRILGRYQGGPIRRGYLVGELIDDRLTFRFAQVETGERLSRMVHAGRSWCEVFRAEQGLVRLLEHFTWITREGTGTNVFDQIRV